MKRKSFLQALGLGALAVPTLFKGIPIKDIEKIELPKSREDIPVENIWGDEAKTYAKCYILEGKRRRRISTKETSINLASHSEYIPEYIYAEPWLNDFDKDFPPIKVTTTLSIHNIRKQAQNFVENIFNARQSVTILVYVLDFEIELKMLPDHIIYLDETKPLSSIDIVFISHDNEFHRITPII